MVAISVYIYIWCKDNFKNPLESGFLWGGSMEPPLCTNGSAGYLMQLTAHNWQKWKRAFPTCPCNKIYRDKAVGLKSCKYTWKITIFVKMWNLGQYRENLIFCQ